MVKKIYKKHKDILILSLLNSFSQHELERFDRFVESKYFNTDQYVVRLLAVFRKKIKNGDLILIDEQFIQIHKKVFNKPIYKKILTATQKSLLTAKMSLLMSLAKRFLVVDNLEENEALSNKVLYQKILQKKQFSLCKRQVNKDHKKIKAITHQGIAYQALAFQVESGQLNYLHLNGLIAKENNLNKLNRHLDLYFMLNKLKLHITAITLSNVIKDNDFDFSSIDALTSFLNLPQYATIPLVKIYQTVIDLLKNKEEKTYDHLLQLLENYQIYISPENLKNFYKSAINFGIYKMRSGVLKYHHQIHELYKIMDQKDLLREKGIMDLIELKNVISIGCQNKDFEWATVLVQKYLPNVQHPDKKSIEHYHFGLIAFYQKNYDQAIHHFIRVDKVNISYDFNCRILLIKSHYEMDQEYDERTMAIFRRAEHFILTNKRLNPNLKKAYRNFIRILIYLYKVRHQFGKSNQEGLMKKMDNLLVIGDKKWLLEKIEEMK